ncbi:ubiquitin-like small modifier protein 1 [Halosegnis sp.]|uniref:ubiquitin-like small modifier protein 1 n=1 Tax=Halosegnis sp. TaxID=2864959 RepID=UPI0035D475A9
MEIHLRFFGTVRRSVGAKTAAREMPSDATVRDLLAALEADHSGLAGDLLDGGDVASGVTVLLDGTNVANRSGAATPLTDGATVAVTPPLTGG